MGIVLFALAGLAIALILRVKGINWNVFNPANGEAGTDYTDEGNIITPDINEFVTEEIAPPELPIPVLSSEWFNQYILTPAKTTIQEITEVFPMGDATFIALANAIKQFEGYFPGSRAYRNNNPGNLKYVRQPGTTGQDDKGFAIFATYQDGWNALIALLKMYAKKYPDWSILDLMNRYAPPVENDTGSYATFLNKQMGVSPDFKIGELS